MTVTTCWESIKIEGDAILDTLKALLHEGNIRRVRVQHQGRTVAEFPLAVGVVGALFAPVLAGVGALLGLLKDCTIQVERETPAATTAPEDTADSH